MGQQDDDFYGKAIEQLKIAATFAKQVGLTILEGKCYNTLGKIYLNQKFFEASEKQYLKDAKICQQEKDDEGLVKTLQCLGIVA